MLLAWGWSAGYGFRDSDSSTAFGAIGRTSARHQDSVEFASRFVVRAVSSTA